MKTKGKIFITILFTVGIGFFLLVNWITRDLTPQFRASTEEPLVDAAWTMAALASTQVRSDVIDVSLFEGLFAALPEKITPAPIYDFIKSNMDLRLYITDSRGIVLFNSEGNNVGANYSLWNDVARTLQGKYGTRTSIDPRLGPGLSVMYVAAPVKVGGKLVGVVSVGKPTRSVNAFVREAHDAVIFSSVITFAVVVIVTLLLSAMITRPIEKLIAYTRAVSKGERGYLPKLGGEMGQLGRSFEEMRIALEGRQYIENYVQTLTHEMKSPLAAVQGAVELLDEAMPEERRRRFHANIESETGRMQRLIDRLLLLSAIENRASLRERTEISLLLLAQQVADSFATLQMTRGVTVSISGSATLKVKGELVLIEQAISNLLHNALEFSPPGGVITVSIAEREGSIRLRVEDQGPGIPEYALSRAFERFYSLKRPDSGKKSSGLGLSLVQEIMALHGGRVTLGNRSAGGGGRAELYFPY